MSDTLTSNEQVTPVDGLIAESRAVLATHLNGTWKDDYAALRLAQMVRALLARIEETTALQRELQRARDTIDTFEMEANPRPAHEPSVVHITIEANRDEAVSDLEMRLQMAHERIAQLVSSSQPPEVPLQPKLDDETVILRRMLGTAQARIMDLERAAQPPRVPRVITPVFELCNAYESGFGHGLQKDDAVSPYPPRTQKAEAYQIGYEEGARRASVTKGGEL
jgi:hypothetical protein